MTDVLIIEDDNEVGNLISDLLINAGFSTALCPDAESGIERLGKDRFRIMLLDVMLPGKNGFETCYAIRSRDNIPIIMMSARDDERSMLQGYENGADDYLEKPFSMPVLIAKIKAFIKRTAEPENSEILSGCGVTLDTASRKVFLDGEEIKLNVKEFDLLKCLMENQGRVMTKDELFDKVWGIDCFTEPSTVIVHIRWLREKLHDDPKSPKMIHTVYKLGYRFGGEK